MSAAVPGSSEQNWLQGKKSSRSPRSKYLLPSAMRPGTCIDTKYKVFEDAMANEERPAGNPNPNPNCRLVHHEN